MTAIPWPSIIGVGGALVSFLPLAVALRHLPAGTGYAVWVGIGAVGVSTRDHRVR